MWQGPGLPYITPLKIAIYDLIFNLSLSGIQKSGFLYP